MAGGRSGNDRDGVNNQTLGDSKGLRYTRQPRCIIRAKCNSLSHGLAAGFPCEILQPLLVHRTFCFLGLEVCPRCQPDRTSPAGSYLGSLTGRRHRLK